MTPRQQEVPDALRQHGPITVDSMGAAEMLGLDQLGRYETLGPNGSLLDIKVIEPIDRLAGVVVESNEEMLQLDQRTGFVVKHHKVFYSNDLSGGYLGATAVAVAATEAQARQDIAVAMAGAGFPQDRAFTVVELDTTKPGVVILDDGDY